MRPDPSLLRELIDMSPAVRAVAGRGCPEPAIRVAEAEVGPLPASFRWWLAEYGSGTVDGTDVVTVAPDGVRLDADDLVGRREGDRIALWDDGCEGPCLLALDQWDGEECAVVRRDPFTGEEERVADSFAGFLTVRTALALGLRDGPNPTVARLWRSVPGVLLPGGGGLYGPHVIREHNAAHGVAVRAPHWVLVGDDGDGGGLFMRRHGRDRTSVHLLGLDAVEHGVEAAGEPLTGDLLAWAAAEVAGRQ
ncbi:SMI1/KNR4 family protein [Streptomyces sp. SHP 1-2]|uniref:SMI1/KNR4 family protein n=1 Tax=Streptomyces sp. SHP 1-2 TaxID=2769489 RepID=UPI0022380DA5|nr:SMI1/KNR4 family protein [Streptomyces sp. SHP 1-2]MCW5251154.1 SMI1/KNR4 family protein [Streptomyces sp. SHP 1-2]